jgi:ABC-type multidrug transport system permease subunit
MLSTYGKRIVKLWKPILITGVILFAVEVFGRFFEKLYFFNPSVYFISSMSIFFLATARVAIPFLSWLIISAEEFKPKK